MIRAAVELSLLTLSGHPDAIVGAVGMVMIRDLCFCVSQKSSENDSG